ncbi:MAG: radical SAM protein [Candidatus Gastranaerophilales bacterium]|nr:radical SAM protein [Candidatus Gastranaerophilales bacterium]
MKYKSCRLAEHGIYFYHDPGTQRIIAGHCCNSDHLNFDDRLYLYFDLKNEKLDWDYIFSEKRKFRENAKKEIYPCQCDGCFELTEREWDDEDYISHFTAGNIIKCNSRCIYCPTGRIESWHNHEQEVDIRPVVEELERKNLLRYNGSLRFVGGEPTLLKEFDWLVDLFSAHNVPEIYVPTSAIRLSKSLCKALEKIESAAVVVSIDSGCRKTFEKVKGTKFYDLVAQNMHTYLNHSRKKNFVIPKFILLTNYNDTTKEIDKWLLNCVKQGYVEVQFDAEHTVSSSEECENKKYVKRTLNMLKYTEKQAEKYGIKVVSFLAFMNRAKRIFENQIAEHKNSAIYPEIGNMPIEEIEQAVQDNKFSPNRRIKIEYKRTDRDKYMKLLRLGFDFDITLNRFENDELLDEILKTSNSAISSKGLISPILTGLRYKKDDKDEK